MSIDIVIVFIILIGTAILLATKIVRNDLSAVFVMLALMLSGTLSAEDAVAGFGNPVLLIIVSMAVVSNALVTTGIAQRVGNWVLTASRGGESRLMVLLMLAAGGVGAFMNSIAAIAIFIPITVSIADKAGHDRKRLLMPLSAGCLTSGMMTLVATSPNLVVNQVLESQGIDKLGFFSFTPFGIAVLFISILFMHYIGRTLLAGKDNLKKETGPRSGWDLISVYGLDDRLFSFCISQNSPLVNRSFTELTIGADLDIQLVILEKSDRGISHFFSGNTEVVCGPGDRMLLIGETEKINALADTYGLERLSVEGFINRQILIQECGLAEIMIAPESRLIGNTLKDNKLRSRLNVNVVSIRRRGTTITEGLAEVKLDAGDTFLVSAPWTDILNLREDHGDFIVLTLPKEFSDVIPELKKAPIALAILIAMIIALIIGIYPTVTATMLAAALLIATRCVKIETIYRNISWATIVLIAGILPLTTALNITGAAKTMSEGLINVLGTMGPLGMLAVIFIITAITGAFLSNTPAAVLISPIAIEVAQSLGVSPQAFAMTVAIACSAAYVTPVSSPVNLLAMEAGGYTFRDFLRVGLPLLALTLVVTVLLVWMIYMR